MRFQLSQFAAVFACIAIVLSIFSSSIHAGILTLIALLPAALVCHKSKRQHEWSRKTTRLKRVTLLFALASLFFLVYALSAGPAAYIAFRMNNYWLFYSLFGPVEWLAFEASKLS